MKVSFCKKNITPQKNLYLCGYIDRVEKSAGILKPIYARISVFGQNSKKYAVIALDILLISRTKALEFQRKFTAKYGLSALVISATHTHAAPALLSYSWVGEADDDFALSVEAAVDEGLKECLGNLLSCVMSYSSLSGYDEIATNRNNIEDVSSIFLNTLAFKYKNKLIGGLINYNCHPTVLSAENLLISPDFPSEVLERIEISSGVFLFTNGAAGDISTRFKRKNQTPEEAMRMGGLLGDKCIELLEESTFCEVNEISFASRDVELSFKTLKSKAEYESLLSEYKEKLNNIDKSSAQHRLAETRLQGVRVEASLLDNKKALETTLSISVLKLDSVIIIFAPGELFSSYQKTLQEKYKNICLVGYSQGYPGYILDEKAYSSRSYEAFSSHLAEGSGEKLFKEIIELIDEL